MVWYGQTRGQWYCLVKRRASWVKAQRRYRATPHGRAVIAATQQRRIYWSRNYLGRAKTSADAQQIRAHIKRRILTEVLSVPITR